MGIISNAASKGVLTLFNNAGIQVTETEPTADASKTISLVSNGTSTSHDVYKLIEPVVDMISPGWTIYVLASSFHLRNRGDPDDTRFPIKEYTIPFADPNAFQKVFDLASKMPLYDSSSHVGVICLEVPDDDVDNESKWKFTVVSGKSVKTNDDGTQLIIESDLFVPGKVIDPAKQEQT